VRNLAKNNLSVWMFLAITLLAGSFPTIGWSQESEPSTWTTVITPQKNNFKSEVLNSKLLVLADVGATWCVPCRLLAPTIDKLAKEYKGRLKIVKIDADQNQDLVGQLGIEGFPTVLFFKNGKVVDSSIGYVPQSDLEHQINRLFKTDKKAVS
jgi:thioredoxin 1